MATAPKTTGTILNPNYQPTAPVYAPQYPGAVTEQNPTGLYSSSPSGAPNSGADQGASGPINPQDTLAFQQAAASGLGVSEGGDVSQAAKALLASQGYMPRTPQNTGGAYTAADAAGAPASQTTTITQGQGTNINNPSGGSDGSEPAPLTEDQVYQKLLSQSGDVINGIQNSYDAQIAAQDAQVNQDEGQTEQDQNAMAAASGLMGSSSAIGGISEDRSAAQTKKQSQDAPLVAQKAQAVAGAIQNIQASAQTEYQNNLAQQQVVLQNAQDAVKTMAEAGVNWDSFKATPAYGQLVDQLGGNSNYADALFTMSQPVGVVDPNLSKVLGNTYYQVTKNPVTGALSSSSFQLPYTPPTNWTSNKVSTTTLMMQDPNNAQNTIIYTTDPISGQVQVTGTGTGAALASEYNSNNGSSSTSSSSTSPTQNPGSSNYVDTVISTSGITDPTTSFATAVNGDGTAANSGIGIGPVVAGVISAEGGSPAGVQNNPGNVKYVPGMAGATDSGVKATDGGTFASFSTPQAGQTAIADTLTNIAQELGPNATTQDVLDTYAGLGSTTSTNTASGVSTAQYGALANVKGFNPNAPGDQGIIDKDAYSYLKLYLSGTQPTNTNLTGKRSSSSSEFSQAQSRAQDLYFQATGQQLPNITEQTANLGFLNANNALLNSLKVQEGTIQANSDLMQGNINADNINQHAPVINGVLDGIQEALGDPNVASYLAQNSTLSNELGSLLALKNASGTTVHDKLISADLISPDASAAQEAKVVNTLMQEAGNAHQAITIANANLYLQTDPLGVDPANPLSNPTQFASEVGLNLPAIQQDYPDMTPQEILTQFIQQH